eukprot:GILJ01009189.1.p1 GENE.GILJ01009189.1~~GILJ01009189.1.p1  ORF type:complete len:366 (-),score=48.72 GILJ01009189.1:447-1544(-)
MKRNFRSAYYESLGVERMKDLEAKMAFETALGRSHLDAKELKKLSLRFGAPPQHRELIWQVVLNVLPADRELWQFYCEQQEEHYEDIFRAATLIGFHPSRPFRSEANAGDLSAKNVPRNAVSSVQSASTLSSLVSSAADSGSPGLFGGTAIFEDINLHMKDLQTRSIAVLSALACFLHVSLERLPHPTNMLPLCRLFCAVCQSTSAAFWCTVRFIQSQARFFPSNELRILSQATELSRHLTQQEPDLSNHLRRCKVDVASTVSVWLDNYLAGYQSLSLDRLCGIFDRLIGVRPDFLVCASLAILISLKSKLMAVHDGAEVTGILSCETDNPEANSEATAKRARDFYHQLGPPAVPGSKPPVTPST